MKVIGSDFLDLAETRLLANDISEFELRSTGSRVYYGVYYKVKEVIEEKGLFAVDMDFNELKASAIWVLHGLGTENSKSLAEGVQSIKKFRYLCDYQLSGNIGPQRAKMKLMEARLLVKRLDRLRASSPDIASYKKD
ncbi:hypothetical protein [Pseudomonas sp. Pseu.R1]|uniref:hypothetical protein n=1 Tax=Pseudomonas sp. Pseu.R1 TaxID=3379818 RepID=UPI003B9266C9